MSVSANKINLIVDGLFERILKRVLPGRYPLQPIFVEKAIEKALTDNTKVFKGGVLPPNRIEVIMSQDDYDDFRQIEALYTRQLEETARNHIENECGKHAISMANPVISIMASPEVSKGMVKIRAEHHAADYEAGR